MYLEEKVHAKKKKKFFLGHTFLKFGGSCLTPIFHKLGHTALGGGWGWGHSIWGKKQRN